MRTLLAIRPKSWEPSLWEVMDSFVLIEYASLRASRTFLQQLLACLNFTLKTKKVICMNYGSCTRSWYLLDTYLTWHLRWGIFTSIPTWTHSRNSIAPAEALWVWRYPPMEHLSNDHEDHPNQHENSHKLCNEPQHPVVNLTEN